MDQDLVFNCLVIVLFLLISAFFSAAETALTAVSRARIFQLVREGNKRAMTVSRLRKNKESMIGAILLGNNVVNIASSAIATAVALTLFSSEQSLLIVTGVMTVLVVVFSEVLPKTYAIQNAERVSLAIAPVMHWVVKILYPITHAIQLFIGKVLKPFGIDITRSNTLVSATDVIRGTIELHHREGQMVKQDRDMLGSILDLNDIEVKDIMVHRTQVLTINAALGAERVVEEALRTLHSRIPLWQDNPDNIIGILHVKDLLKAMALRGSNIDRAALDALIKKPWFIPETTSVRDQLLAFRARKQHFACVVDEYGVWLGIVTLEDILEEIVGHIDDEHDEVSLGIMRAGPRAVMVHGEVSIRDLNRAMDWDLPDDHASTIGGLLMHEIRDIPSREEEFVLFGYLFTVVEKGTTQITRLRIERLPPRAEGPAS